MNERMVVFTRHEKRGLGGSQWVELDGIWIGDYLGSDVSAQLHLDAADVLAGGSHVEEYFRVGHFVWRRDPRKRCKTRGSRQSA
jgi:hypothetical protein